MNVSSGGTASGVSVGSGGTLTVSSGGVVSALTIKDPNDPGVTAEANVLSGGTVDGSTKIDGGQLILDAGAVFQPHAALTIINSGWLVLEQDSFKGTIHDFGGQDFMDLTKIKFIGQETAATFTQTSGAGGPLQVAQGNHVVDLHLTGTYTTANFALASDGAHGTLVAFVPNARCRDTGSRHHSDRSVSIRNKIHKGRPGERSSHPLARRCGFQNGKSQAEAPENVGLWALSNVRDLSAIWSLA